MVLWVAFDVDIFVVDGTSVDHDQVDPTAEYQGCDETQCAQITSLHLRLSGCY